MQHRPIFCISICICICIFVLFIFCICISFHLPSCSAAAAVGDLDKSAAPSQIHLQPVTFICATVWPQRNTFDRLEEIQLIKWQKYNQKGEINPVEILTKYSHLIPSFAPTFICVTLRLASSSSPRPTFCALPGKYLWHKYRFEKYRNTNYEKYLLPTFIRAAVWPRHCCLATIWWQGRPSYGPTTYSIYPPPPLIFLFL